MGKRCREKGLLCFLSASCTSSDGKVFLRQIRSAGMPHTTDSFTVCLAGTGVP